jgi:hypothetical protein
MEFIQPKNSFLEEITKSNIIDALATKIIAIPEFKKFKLDIELLKLICNLIEYQIKPSSKQKNKIDKKQIVLLAYEKAFGFLTVVEKEVIDKNIQFLFENKKIKKSCLLKLVLKKATSIVLKKLTI